MDTSDASLSLRLPADLLKHARSIARSRDESLAQVIRRALRSYVASGPQQLSLEDAARDAKRGPKAAPKRSRR